MIQLTLTHYTDIGLVIPKSSSEQRLFSTREKAEEWLQQNGFALRPRTFLKGDPIEWCHEKEKGWDYVDVQMTKWEVDGDKPYHFESIEAPWIKAEEEAIKQDVFIELMQDKGYDEEEIREEYKKRFGTEYIFVLPTRSKPFTPSQPSSEQVVSKLSGTATSTVCR